MTEPHSEPSTQSGLPFEGTFDQTRQRAAAELYEDVELSGTLPDGVTAQEAVAAVLCTVSRRIARGESEQLRSELPPDLIAVLEPCMGHRAEAPEVFGRDEFFHRVAQHLDTSVGQAAAIVRHVFAALQANYPSREVDDVESQLPADLKALWRGA